MKLKVIVNSIVTTLAHYFLSGTQPDNIQAEVDHIRQNNHYKKRDISNHKTSEKLLRILELISVF